jgi:hypothetical protein
MKKKVFKVFVAIMFAFLMTFNIGYVNSSVKSNDLSISSMEQFSSASAEWGSSFYPCGAVICVWNPSAGMCTYFSGSMGVVCYCNCFY